MLRRAPGKVVDGSKFYNAQFMAGAVEQQIMVTGQMTGAAYCSLTSGARYGMVPPHVTAGSCKHERSQVGCIPYYAITKEIL